MDEKIDIVYLWCDANDPAFRAEKNKYAGIPNDNFLKETRGDFRFRDNDELRFSLRSIEKHAPWINHIFIVTWNQKPAWLNTNNPRVTVVDHSEILPAAALPVFNSGAIESVLYKIPGLSEFFLFANDDMFIGGNIMPEFFFTEKGLPVIRGKKYGFFNKRLSLAYYTRKKADQIWTSTMLRSLGLVLAKFGDTLLFQTHHNIDPYRKSFYRETAEIFKEEYDRVAFSRFRERDNIKRVAVQAVDYVKKRAVFKPVKFKRKKKMLKYAPGFYFGADSYYFDLGELTEREKNFFRSGKYKLFCINDDPNASRTDMSETKKFLLELYPTPSSFEIAGSLCDSENFSAK